LRHVSLLDQAFFFHGGPRGGARRHARAKRRDVGEAGEVNADFVGDEWVVRARAACRCIPGAGGTFLAVQTRRIKDQ